MGEDSQRDSLRGMNHHLSPEPPSSESKCIDIHIRDASGTIEVDGSRKRTWSSIKSNGNMVLRALGLGILSSVTQRWLRSRAKEPLKIVLRQNRLIALLRSLIHIVPISIALWLVTLNWVTYYVGSFTLNQVYYQIGAKALEIMIQASLAAIVLGYIRHELILGKGLPFGTLFSGLQVNQISYLWSMEFWGSIGSKSLSVYRKTFLFIFLLLVFVLAAGAGPSTAVLLIPRRDYWPAGSTHIWINGTKGDIWPTQLNGSLISVGCAISTEATVSNSCPSSEWQMIDTWLRLFEDGVPRRYESEAPNPDPPASLEFSGKVSLRPLYCKDLVATVAEPLTSLEDYQISVFTTQQSVIADTLVHTAATWIDAVDNIDGHFSNHGVSPLDQQSVVHTISQNYYQPYIATLCIQDSIKAQNDARPISIPVIAPNVYNPVPNNLQNLTYIFNGVPVIDYPPLKRAQLLDIEGSESDYRIKWFELPSRFFNVSGLGAVIVIPSQYSKTTNNVEIVTCNLNAGWGSSSVNITDTALGLSATSSLMKAESSQLGPNKPLTPSGDPGQPLDRYQRSIDAALNYLPPDFPSPIISIQEEWAEYLNPRIPNLNTTIIDYMMKASAVKHPDALAEYTLGILLTNGLARIGADYQFQGNPQVKQGPDGMPEVDGTFWLSGKGDFFTVDPEEAKNWLKLQIDSTIQGYAYNTRGTGPKTAIAFLLAYCALAFTYTIYSTISGNSSTAWDSISEVTALAMNSAPTKDLQNTCGGISEMRTFNTPVRVVVRKDRGEDEGEHLELVFGDHASGNPGGSDTIKSNRAYGRLSLREVRRAAVRRVGS